MNFARRTKCFKCGNLKPESEAAPYYQPKLSKIVQQPLPNEEETPEQKSEPRVMTERVRVEEEMKRWEKEQQKVERLNNNKFIYMTLYK